MSTANITSVLKETRQFPPSPEFAAQAHIKSLAEYEKLWQRAKDDPRGLLGRAGGVAGLVPQVGQGPGLERAASPSGSSAARSTPAITASTAISTMAAQQQGRHHLGRRAGRYAASCATRTCTARSASSPTSSRSSASSPATASRSTCR